MTERHAQFIKEPVKVVDALDYVIKKLSEQSHKTVTADEICQLDEITKAIDRLKNSGAKVPDELRKLKIQLSAVVTEHENALQTLQTLELRLSNTITDLRAKVKQLADKSQNTQKPKKRYVKRTSPTLLRKEITKALRELGGSAKRSEILDKIRENMDGRFKPDDLERDANEVLNWEKWVVGDRAKMMKEGVLKTGGNQKIWELRRK